jgi:TfoX/Sxy family transcriptional regulator of competence genes
MSHDEKLAAKVAGMLSRKKGVESKNMFGGVTWILAGNMFCGVVRDDLIARVGTDRYDEAIRVPHVRPMDFTGRPMKGYVFVGPGGLKTDAELRRWVDQSFEYVQTLPARDPNAKPPPPPGPPMKKGRGAPGKTGGGWRG